MCMCGAVKSVHVWCGVIQNVWKLGSDNTSMYNFNSIYGGQTHVIISTPDTCGLLEQERVELNSIMLGDSASGRD